MTLVKPHNRWVIVTSYLLALLLSVFPLAYEGRWLRPEFLSLCVIFWVIYSPHQINVLMLVLMGCLQDLLEGTLLGQHSLALLSVAYLCVLSSQRFRYYLSWQQSFVVFMMVALHQLVDNWVHSFNGGASSTLEFLMPAFTSALLWPLVFIVLDRLRLNFRVS